MGNGSFAALAVPNRLNGKPEKSNGELVNEEHYRHSEITCKHSGQMLI